MDAIQLMKNLSHSSIVTHEIAMEMQLGLPLLERKHGRLCLTCLPHQENCVDDQLLFFCPQYKITWVYPFEHVVCFENFLYSEQQPSADPAVKLPLKTYAGRGKYLMDELYAQCSRVLSAQEQDGCVSNLMLQKYQRLYRETVEELGLTSVYEVVL